MKEEKSALNPRCATIRLFAERKAGIGDQQTGVTSGTSIGAWVRESEYAQSKSDFIQKLSIALKEANETEYWLSLLSDRNYIEAKLYTSISEDLRQLLRILTYRSKHQKETTIAMNSEQC